MKLCVLVAESGMLISITTDEAVMVHFTPALSVKEKYPSYRNRKSYKDKKEG